MSFLFCTPSDHTRTTTMSAEIPLCPACLELAKVETPCERKTSEKPESDWYGKWFYVCPDAENHPQKKVFIPEAKWLKQLNFKKREAALAAENPAPATSAPAAPTASKKSRTTGPSEAAANSAPGATPASSPSFGSEWATLNQTMLDVLVMGQKVLHALQPLCVSSPEKPAETTLQPPPAPIKTEPKTE